MAILGNMANYNNYPAKAIDHKILIIQNALSSSLGFQNIDFYGRVLKGLDKDGNSLVPEVMISGTESKEVYYNDQKAKGGNVFFVDSNEHTTKDGKLFTAKVKIVFMLNLSMIQSTEITDSEAQDICIKLIQRIKALEITGIETGLKNVLKDFNIQNIKLNDTRPFHTFSINGELKYIFNCNQ
jgi:hypothetical protein